MSSYKIVTWNPTTKSQPGKESSTTAFDFLSVRIGAANLPISQSGSGGSAQFDLGGKVVGNAADPLIATDLATKNYVDTNAVALVQVTGPANISGTYSGNVRLVGLITMTGNVVIKGNLILANDTVGFLTKLSNSNTYSLEVEGDVFLHGYYNLTNNLVTTIDLSGINGSVSVAATAGGSITIHGSVHSFNDGQTNILTNGGTATNAAFPAGANGGAVIIKGNLGPVAVLQANGGGGISSAAAGGGAPIIITGNCSATLVEAKGGAQSSTGNPGPGGTFLALDTTSSVNTSGGTSTSNGAAGRAAGTVTARNFNGAITANGGNGAGGGTGGAVTLTGNLFGSISATGGTSSTSAAAGNGGAASVQGNIKTVTSATTLDGGANSSTGLGGNGGALTAGSCIFASLNVTTKGGNSSSGTGGNGGNISIGGIVTGVGALTYTGGTGSVSGTSGSVSYT